MHDFDGIDANPADTEKYNLLLLPTTTYTTTPVRTSTEGPVQLDDARSSRHLVGQDVCERAAALPGLDRRPVRQLGSRLRKELVRAGSAQQKYQHQHLRPLIHTCDELVIKNRSSAKRALVRAEQHQENDYFDGRGFVPFDSHQRQGRVQHLPFPVRSRATCAKTSKTSSRRSSTRCTLLFVCAISVTLVMKQKGRGLLILRSEGQGTQGGEHATKVRTVHTIWTDVASADRSVRSDLMGLIPIHLG